MDPKSERQTDTQTQRQTDTQTERQADRAVSRQQKGRQTDGWIDRYGSICHSFSPLTEMIKDRTHMKPQRDRDEGSYVSKSERLGSSEV